MKKVLINVDTIKANANRSQAIDAAQVINIRLIPALEAIGQTINDTVLKDCLMGANATRESYFNSVQADTKGTKTPGIKKQLEDAGAEAWENFEQELTFVRREARNTNFLTIVDGACTLTPENEEKLEDLSRTYLTEPAEIEAYNLHVEIIEKLNQLFQGRAPFRWIDIFLEDPAGKICRNDETNYSKLV